MLDSGNELSLTLTEWIIVQDEQNVTEVSFPCIATDTYTLMLLLSNVCYID